MASEIRIYSGGAPRAALKPLAAEFERTTGQPLAFTFDGVSAIRDKLASGQKADVILLPTPMIDAMGSAVLPGSRTQLAARSIAYSDPKLAPSGIHVAQVLANLGIADDVQSKTVLRTPFGGGVALVATGEVEIGIYLVSEIQAVEGVTLAGLLPGELQSYVIYAGAVAADSPFQDAALAFLRFLADPAGSEHWKAAGFESV